LSRKLNINPLNLKYDGKYKINIRKTGIEGARKIMEGVER